MLPASRLVQILLVLPLACGAGCGADKYEERLQASVAYFNYMEVLNQNLAPRNGAWSRPDFGLSMRAPLPFQWMALPAPPEVAEGETPPEPGPDPRQPHFLGFELPGLIDAWQAQLNDLDNQPVDARLYVLGNHQRFLDQQSNLGAFADPATFLDELELHLQQMLSVTLPEGEAGTGNTFNERSRQKIPPKEFYAVPKDLTAITFNPSEDWKRQAGVNWQVQVYEYRAGQIQVAVVLVCPESALSRADARLKLALETLAVSDQIPRAAGPGAPAAGGGGTSAF